MRTSAITIAGVIWASCAVAQDRPLSAIDWLSEEALSAIEQETIEPSVTASGAVPGVSVAPLDDEAGRRIGLVPSDITGLPDDLWAGAQAEVIARRLGSMSKPTIPALQTLYYTLLLAEADPPSGATTRFDLARVDALTRLGALDPALDLIIQAGPDRSPDHFRRFMDLSLIAGREAQACAVLAANPHLARDEAFRVFCGARGGDWDTAVLLLGTSEALEVVPAPRADVLARFLDPELYEGEPDLAIPERPDPLDFRLFEAIGTPIPTRVLPRIFANADLGDRAGWKAQLEAAERLSETGALPENRLLGIYTGRRPAASGGIWDRVEAVQRLDLALGAQSTDAVAKTLPEAWASIRASRLAVPFANLFAPRLKDHALTGLPANTAFEMMLLGGATDDAVRLYPDRAQRAPLLVDLAQGQQTNPPLTTPVEETIYAAFSGPGDAPGASSLGMSLLDALDAVEAGVMGDVAQLRTGLSRLRGLGFEDRARKAALQILILGAAT